MLTDSDIQKIIKANQEIFITKKDFDDLKSDIAKDNRKDFESFKEDNRKDFESFKEDNRKDFESFKEDIVKFNQEIFATKEDFENFKDEMRKNFSDLQIAVDAYAKRADTYFQEMVMLSNKVNRQEKWIQQIAEKVGVQLGY